MIVLGRIDPNYEDAVKDSEEKKKQYDDAMKSNKDGLKTIDDLNKLENTGEKISSTDLKKMHLSESLFEDLFEDQDDGQSDDDLVERVCDILNGGFTTIPNQAREIIDLVRYWDQAGDNHFLESYQLNEDIIDSLIDDINKDIVGDVDVSLGEDFESIPFRIVNTVEEKYGMTMEEFDKLANDIANEVVDEYPEKYARVDIYDIEANTNGLIAIDFVINNGDWKWDHERFKDWMNEFAENHPEFKTKYVYSENIGESGRDVSDQIHRYYFTPTEEFLNNRENTGTNISESLDDFDKDMSAEKLGYELIKECPVSGFIDVYDTSDEPESGTKKIEFEVKGDWKHEHLAFKYWMNQNAEELTGYDVRYAGEEVTEEDGSDNYTAVHTFLFIPKELAVDIDSESSEDSDNKVVYDYDGNELDPNVDFDEEPVSESLKFNIAKEQLKRYNEGKMSQNWDPKKYLNSLVEHNHITQEESKVLTETFLK